MRQSGQSGQSSFWRRHTTEEELPSLSMNNNNNNDYDENNDAYLHSPITQVHDLHTPLPLPLRRTVIAILPMVKVRKNRSLQCWCCDEDYKSLSNPPRSSMYYPSASAVIKKSFSFQRAFLPRPQEFKCFQEPSRSNDFLNLIFGKYHQPIEKVCGCSKSISRRE
ncbi:hypothetical protein Glove_707g59 [Diversispora epigaea]|uniref:Uncharacterized protein n=1 Tax=Diversispora epigaea TaxID=1348612 RepID=A0A397G1U2_9GLOM|nr:hypothetical protein Glove_707g59 [Diversispora epigaea]